MKTLAEQYKDEPFFVILGINQPSTLRIMATTFKSGDPSFAGPLGGIALGIDSYHIFELKKLIPDDVWTVEMGMVELEIEEEKQEEIIKIIQEIREGSES